MSIIIRTMTAADLNACYSMTQHLKWPHRPEDWQQALALGEGIVAEDQGELVGSAIGWRWGEHYATLGLVIVSDAHQGRGIGKQLMLGLLEKYPGYNVRLHATEMGKGLYEKLGFRSYGHIQQHQTRALASVPPVMLPQGISIHPAGVEDAAQLTALDHQAHGLLRPALIDQLLSSATVQVARQEDGSVRGFAALRRFGHGWAIGPVIAADLASAQALVASLMQGLQGEFVRIDTDGSLTLGEWLNTLGLVQVDAPVLMVKGTPWTAQADGMQPFGLMTQAMA